MDIITWCWPHVEIGSERLNGVFIMSISVKLNKNGIKKLQKELEQEMKKRTIVREGVGLRKDSEKFLKIVLPLLFNICKR